MGLIDADELKEWVENWFTKNKHYHPYSKSNDIPINELYDILEQMPTIDAEPVRHGRWIECESENGIHIHKCSECGKRDMYKGAFKDFNGRGFSFYYKRQCCPYCGAKMDLDEVKE